MKLGLFWAASALALGALACRTEQRRAPAGADRAVAESADPVRAFRVTRAGALVGYVVLFESSPGRGFYSVRNPFHQELGMIDSNGRAWRFRPFEEQAEWLVTGTLLEGARRILDAGEGAALEEISLAAALSD